MGRRSTHLRLMRRECDDTGKRGQRGWEGPECGPKTGIHRQGSETLQLGVQIPALTFTSLEDFTSLSLSSLLSVRRKVREPPPGGCCESNTRCAEPLVHSKSSINGSFIREDTLSSEGKSPTSSDNNRAKEDFSLVQRK